MDRADRIVLAGCAVCAAALFLLAYLRWLPGATT
jgi:hypothetical protein